jgi:CelD/BcsL family acetyltransferase involved in cellulose biosynthesis
LNTLTAEFFNGPEPEWDAFVESHPAGWITHSFSWKRALEKSFGHVKGSFIVIREGSGGPIVAGLPIYLLESWFKGKRLVSIPFATLCDPLITAPSQVEPLWFKLREMQADLGASCVEVRAFRCEFPVPSALPYTVSNSFAHHYISLDRDIDSILMSFHRTSIRQGVRRAMRSNLRIDSVDTPDGLARFYELYRSTRKRLGLPTFPISFFRSQWEEFHPSGKLKLLTAKLRDTWVAALWLFLYKDRVSAEAIGWEDSHEELRPTCFIFWKAINMARAEGYRVFDFGRTDTANHGLMDYKRRWGTSVVDLPVYRLGETARHSLIKKGESAVSKNSLLRRLIRHSPDSVIRLLGNIWYQHLA